MNKIMVTLDTSSLSDKDGESIEAVIDDIERAIEFNEGSDDNDDWRKFYIRSAIFNLTDILFDDDTVTMYDLIDFHHSCLVETLEEMISIPKRGKDT